mgnify:CR=1 FL=1
MENKTKILAFAAVALMFAVCFIGFTAINDGEVDAEDATTTVDEGPLDGMFTDGMTYADGVYTLTKDVTVTLTDNVSMNDVKFVGKYTLTIMSETGKHFTLSVTYDFKTTTDKVAGNIFEVSSFVLDGANLNVIQKDTGKTEGPKSNQAGCSVFGTGSVEVKGTSTMTITTNKFANRVFYNNGSSLSIDGENAKVVLEKATSSTVSLSMTDGATLEINNPIKTAGNFYPNINNVDADKKVNIVVTGAAGDHAVFFYGTNSNAKDATVGVLKNCIVKTDGIVGIYGSGNVINATGTTIEADSIVAVNATKSFGETPVYFDAAGISSATLKVKNVSKPIMSRYTDSVGTKILKLEGVTFDGTTVIDSGASLSGTITNNGTIIVKDATGLKTAVAAGGKISLANDVALDKVLYITKEVTIDLSGHKISEGTTWEEDANGDALICVKRGGILTINDSSVEKTGAVDGSKRMVAIKMTEFIKTDKNATGADAKLYVNGGSITGTDYAISGNGNRNGTYIEITGGTFTSTEGTAIYLPQKGVTKITNGIFIGKDSAIEIRSGSLEISGGRFESKAESFTVTGNGDGTTTSGAAIAIAQHTTKQAIDVKITGGTFIGPRAINESNPQANTSPNVVVDIQGGTFNGMIAITEKNKANVSVECAFTVESEADKRWYFNGSEIVDAVKEINKITSGDVTLEIFENINITEAGAAKNAALWFTKGVTINGNDKIIIYNATSGNGFNVLGFNKNVTATVKNLTIDGNEKAFHGINIFQATKVTLEDVIVKDVTATGVNVNASAVEMKNCNVIGATGWGGVNVDAKNDSASLTVDGTFSGMIWTESKGNNTTVTYDDSIVTWTSGTWQYWYSPDYQFTAKDIADFIKAFGNANISVSGTLSIDEAEIFVPSQKSIVFERGSIFTGTIKGPEDNKLVANGMKAGNGGITITGGSLIINGKIMDANGVNAGVTVAVTGNAIKVEGTLESGATMVIEEGTVVTVENGKTFSSEGTVNNNGIIDNKGIITNDGVLTNDGTIKMTGASEIKTNVENNKVVNNGVVVDERAKEKPAVPVTNDGTVVAKNNADQYKKAKIDVVEQDPDKPVATEGKIEVNTNKYAFITPVTTTGKLNIVMNDGYKQYTVTIPEGTAIAAGTVISVSFIEYQSDSVTRYQINTPGIENFSMKLPCQIGFKKAKVYCDDSELGVSKVRYDAGTGYVTFDASHNSVFTIVLSNASHAGTTTVSGGDASNDYSLVIAFVVLVASLGFLAYVIKKR